MITSPCIQTLTQWSGPEHWRAALPHSEDHHIILWLTRGQGKVILEGCRRGMGQHNALCIPAGTLFALDLSRQCFGTLCLIPDLSPTQFPAQPEHLRIREVQNQTELTAIFEAMHREQELNRPYLDQSMKAYADLLTIWFHRNLPDPQTPQARHPAAARLVIAYARLIEQNYTSGQTMAEYAKALNVTPTHLTRSCRQVSGYTAADLLIRRILYAARCLLQDSRRPFNEVAMTLGFSSAAYFTRFVSHNTGKTPSALRKSFLQISKQPGHMHDSA